MSSTKIKKKAAPGSACSIKSSAFKVESSPETGVDKDASKLSKEPSKSKRQSSVASQISSKSSSFGLKESSLDRSTVVLKIGDIVQVGLLCGQHKRILMSKHLETLYFPFLYLRSGNGECGPFCVANSYSSPLLMTRRVNPQWSGHQNQGTHQTLCPATCLHARAVPGGC